jgi:hypothetical protein
MSQGVQYLKVQGFPQIALHNASKSNCKKIRLRYALGPCYDIHLKNAGHPSVLDVDAGNGVWQGTTGSR